MKKVIPEYRARLEALSPANRRTPRSYRSTYFRDCLDDAPRQ
jgi:hypothetical protein